MSSMDCVNVNFLVWIMYYSFQAVNTGRDWVKGALDLPISLHLPVNLWLLQNKKLNFFKNQILKEENYLNEYLTKEDRPGDQGTKESGNLGTKRRRKMVSLMKRKVKEEETRWSRCWLHGVTKRRNRKQPCACCCGMKYYNMDLDNIMQNERSQKKRSHIAWFHLYEISRIGKSIETESRLVVAKG